MTGCKEVGMQSQQKYLQQLLRDLDCVTPIKKKLPKRSINPARANSTWEKNSMVLPGLNEQFSRMSRSLYHQTNADFIVIWDLINQN